jgi:hypothetical protein
MQTVSSGILSAVLIVMGDHGASAQSVASPATVQPIPAYCGAYKLNAAEFMKTIHTIIEHGDLTDIPFIETTLGTKFAIIYGWKLGGIRDPQKLNYQTQNVLGSPIDASVRIWPNEPAELGFDGSRFPEVERNYITDCLRLPVSEIVAVYKGPYTPGIPVGNVPVRLPPNAPPPPPEPIEVTLLPDQGMPAKNGSKIYVSFSYEGLPNDLYGGDNLIDSVGLVQRP